MSTFLHYVHCKDALLDCSAPGGERCESLTWVDEIQCWLLTNEIPRNTSECRYNTFIIKHKTLETFILNWCNLITFQRPKTKCSSIRSVSYNESFLMVLSVMKYKAGFVILLIFFTLFSNEVNIKKLKLSTLLQLIKTKFTWAKHQDNHNCKQDLNKNRWHLKYVKN